MFINSIELTALTPQSFNCSDTSASNSKDNSERAERIRSRGRDAVTLRTAPDTIFWR